MTYKKLIYFLTFFVLISFSYAQPPFQTSTLSSELQIIYLKEDAFRYNVDNTLHFHVHNGTGYIVNNTMADCQFHLYGNTGNHIIENDNVSRDSNDIDYEVSIVASDIPQVGDYSFTFFCNSSQNQAGYVSGLLRFTNSGEYDENSGFKWVAIIITLIAMTGLLGVAAGMIKDKSLTPTKTILFFLFIINIFMLGIVSWIVSVNPFDSMSFQFLGIGYASINVILILGFTWNYVFSRLFKAIRKTIKQRRGTFDKYTSSDKK